MLARQFRVRIAARARLHRALFFAGLSFARILAIDLALYRPLRACSLLCLSAKICFSGFCLDASACLGHFLSPVRKVSPLTQAHQRCSAGAAPHPAAYGTVPDAVCNFSKTFSVKFRRVVPLAFSPITTVRSLDELKLLADQLLGFSASGAQDLTAAQVALRAVVVWHQQDGADDDHRQTGTNAGELLRQHWFRSDDDHHR